MEEDMKYLYDQAKLPISQRINAINLRSSALGGYEAGGTVSPDQMVVSKAKTIR